VYGVEVMTEDEEESPEPPQRVTVGNLAKVIGSDKLGIPATGILDVIEAATRGQMSEIAESLRATAENLRIPIKSLDFPEPIPELTWVGPGLMRPSPEVAATRAVLGEIASLREVTAASAEQIAAIADIAAELKPALQDYTRSVGRSNLILLALTFVLVVLTVVLVVRAF
jgi:hypothetical protein